jgi:hypothetical protein
LMAYVRIKIKLARHRDYPLRWASLPSMMDISSSLNGGRNFGLGSQARYSLVIP